MAKDKSYCRGCRENYYNGQGADECWSLKSAKIVTRFRIDWWTRPTEPGAFTEVKTYQCHSAPGKYAHYEKLPTFAVNPARLKRKQSAA